MKPVAIQALCAILIMLPWAVCPAHPDLLDQIERQSALIEQNPGDVEALLKRGELHRRHDEFELSAADFLRARELEPAHGMLNWHEGLLALDTHDFELSNRLLSQYLESNSQHAAAWYWRGQARVGMQQYLAAADDFSKAIKTASRPSPVLYRAQVLSLVASGWAQADHATAVTKEALGHFPRDVTLLGLAVDLMLANSDTAGAMAYFSRVSKRLLELPQWQFRQASWLCISGEQDKARAAFAELLSGRGEGEGEQVRSGTWVPPGGLDAQLSEHPDPGRCVGVMREYLQSQHP